MASTAIIPEVVTRHVEEVANLYGIRAVSLDAPHLTLHDLRRTFDDRLAAHLVGLTVAGSEAWPFCEAALENPTPGTVFTVAVRALENKDLQRLGRLLALAEALPETRRGLEAAFGWLASEQLRGVVVGLLAAESAVARTIGIAACSMHRVDPGLLSANRISDDDPSVRARALRTAGEIGCLEALPACMDALGDADPECAFWGAWSCAVLGKQGRAIEMLRATAVAGDAHRRRAFNLLLQAMKAGAAHKLLQSLTNDRDPEKGRWLIQGSGIVGEGGYAPWLMNHMKDDDTARIAAEAFTLITGTNLVEAGLEARPPEGFQSGPSDDADDTNVEMDPDDGLPWPDVKRIEEWWAANGHRFQKGVRYFMGQPVNKEHCIHVLKSGYQRQRILAAHYLCLLEPGTPLFNTSAPAWRQQRLLANM